MNATQIPEAVASLLGPAPRRLTGYGESVVVAGRGRVAKIGPADVVAREARILGQRVGRMPLEVPTLVASGTGWLVMEEVADIVVRWDESQYVELLVDLAALHDAFEDAPALSGRWLRDPSGAHLQATLAEGGDRSGIELPAALARILDDPAPVAQILAESRPVTLVHGDPTPGNVRRAAIGHRVWIDWEWASAASAAVDLACWLNEWPWAFGRRYDRELCIDTYLRARRRPVDRAQLGHALDAAIVVFFFASNLPSLARASGTEALNALIAEGFEALQRLGLG